MDIKNISDLCISCHYNCDGFCAGRSDFYGKSVDNIVVGDRCPEYRLSFDLFCKKYTSN